MVGGWAGGGGGGGGGGIPLFVGLDIRKNTLLLGHCDICRMQFNFALFSEIS